jgi:hypothetical protein
MRRIWIVVWTCYALGAASLACAESEELPAEPSPEPGGGIVAMPDSGLDAGRVEDAPVGPGCSPAGWCETKLPDSDLLLKSIWPMEGRAFATAESPTVGVKVLEWEDSAGEWKYIDDNSQNQTGLARYISNVWAASENEVYYAVAKGMIVHGTRPAPGSPWTWTADVLEDRSPVHPSEEHDYPREPISNELYPTLGVWGVPGGQPYAWYTNTIYHRASVDGGAPSWVAEYTADDIDVDGSFGRFEHLFALGAAGSGEDDLWFAFARTNAFVGFTGACPVIVRKTNLGYRRISDGVIGQDSCSAPRPGYAMLAPERGWLIGLESLGPGRVIGVLGGRRLVRISAEGDDFTIDTAAILSLPSLEDWENGVSPFFGFLYNAPEGHLWASGTGLPGTAIAVSAESVWSDSGTYALSTLTLTGAPLEGSMYRIRGTSNSNLWIVGDRHALHKTQ